MRSEFFLSRFFCFYEAVLVLFCWQSLLRANLLHCRELCNLCRSISVAIFTCSKFINVCVFMYRMSWFFEICISNLIQYVCLHSTDISEIIFQKIIKWIRITNIVLFINGNIFIFSEHLNIKTYKTNLFLVLLLFNQWRKQFHNKFIFHFALVSMRYC